MKAFKRLDHLLCRVSNIEEWFELLHGRHGLPIAWPIGRFWPGVKAGGIGLGGINLELIQPDEDPPSIASIDCLAFEPTQKIESALHERSIPYEVFEKVESDPELLRLRSLPDNDGPQKLCTNISFKVSEPAFPFFACAYVPSLSRVLGPEALLLPGGNEVRGIVIGHPEPSLVERQLQTFGIESGVPIRVTVHSRAEVVGIQMKHPLKFALPPSTFEFTS